MTVSAKVQIKKDAKKAQRQLDVLNKSLQGKQHVVIGLPANSNNYPDGTSVIEVGIVHEFGIGKVPQRSFLRATLQIKKRNYKALFKKLSKQMVVGKIDKAQALGLMGAQFQADIIDRISTGIPPELKIREGTALIDTGHLRQSITFEVRD